MRLLNLIIGLLCPGFLATAGTIVGIGAGLNSLFGGSSGGGGGNSGSPGYSPTGLGGADQSWQGYNQQQQNNLNYGGGLSNNINPAFLQSFQQGMGINYDPYLQASQQAGQQYGQLAGLAGQFGDQSRQQAMQGFGQQQNLQGMGNQLWNTAQDPQQALYKQQYQQTMDQANAVNSMYGLGSSGAGAGMAQQAGNNFNLGWQNQQLARQLQGAQGVASLNQAGIQAGTQGSANLQAGMGYYGQQPGFQQQAGQVPLNAQQYAAAQPGQLGATYASQVGQGNAPYGQQQGQITPYLFQGAGATGNAYANQMAGNDQFNSNLQGLGKTLGQAGKIDWGKLSGLFGGNSNQGVPTSGDYANMNWLGP
jgi:hypothetical protein